MNVPFKSKVFVAMSGGVDSSVAAALLKKQKYQITGVFMKLADGGADRKTEKRAGKVAAVLKIPFLVWDLRKEFKKKVIDYFLKEYRAGRTPNPCVVCNAEIKFGLFLKKALLSGADFIATGHYLKLRNTLAESGNSYVYRLFQAEDKNKDQSYFLWQLKQRQLRRCWFPLGNLTKDQVRNLAKKFRLPVSKIPESQEICFIGTTINDFLKKHLKFRSGDIITPDKKVIGRHNGLIFYTIGQRKGFGLAGGPYYLIDKNLKKNLLVVSKNEKDLFRKELTAKNFNWISGIKPEAPVRVMAKIRYRHQAVPALIVRISASRVMVKFNQPQRAITPGQSAVFYSSSGELLGGGIIE